MVDQPSKQEQILKAIEETTALVAGLSSNFMVVGAAVMAIKAVISMVVGESLEGPEYAAAMQRGIDRNRTKIGDRIDVLEGQPPTDPNAPLQH